VNLMNPAESYFNGTVSILDRIRKEQMSNIEAAADWLATVIAEGRVVHVFGTGGHSYMAGEEVMYRAGGLAPMSGILDGGVSLVHGARRTTLIERTAGYADAVLEWYGVGEGDVLIVSNNSGLNAVTIDAALGARRRGAKVIGIASVDCSKPVPADHPARHPSSKNLFEVVDLFIDTCVPFGDALVDIPGCDQKVGPVSTIAIAFVLHSIEIVTVQRLIERGIAPPVWRSANIPGGDEVNKEYFEKYSGMVKHL
jgi:uncharacterized phosphosugar-binding protein